MRTYKLTIAYDGTNYQGWQRQSDTDRTIQGILEETLENCIGYQVQIDGSGRTDAGVHAIGQVANFHLDEHFSAEEIFEDLNRHLPEDIAVTKIEEVDDRFHSRYQAVEKTYRYRIRTSPVPNVFERKFLYQYGQTLDVDKMKKAAQALVGTHDFASFCGNRHMKKSTVRTIFSIDLVERDGEIEILYCGNGFLQNMVRILTGTLIEVGRGERAPESMPALLKAKERKQAGYTAPPQGLRLEKVTYETMDGRC